MSTETTAAVKYVNFELEQYILDVFHEIYARVYSDSEGALKEDKFTEYCLEQLEAAGETEGMVVCNYVKPNERGNIEIKVNGYALKDGYESLDLFITLFKDSSSLFNLKKSESDDLIKYVTKFANASLKGHLEDIDISHPAQALASEIKRCRETLDRINIFILTNGNVPSEVPAGYKISGFEEINILFHVWDIERFHRLSQSADNREPIEIHFADIYPELIPCLKMPVKNEVYECYLAIVPAKVLSILYSNYSTRLLESNVRAFLQQTAHNKGISDTIRGPKSFMFLPYNNGLAVTAAEVETEFSNSQLYLKSVKDFQIVNGGQTTASLFHTEKKYKADLKDIYVQVKLTVIRDQELKNVEVPNISRYANSQNKVSELDLSSNHPFLQRLEKLSRTTYAVDPENHNHQTIWFFERVKGQYRELLSKEPTRGKQEAFKHKYPIAQKFVKSEIAKYQNTWEQKPYHVSLGAEKNYIRFMEAVKKEYVKKEPGRTYFQDLIANAILFKTAEQLFGRKGKNPIGDTNIRSFIVTYGLSYFHYLVENRLNLGKIWADQVIDDHLKTEVFKVMEFVNKFFNSHPGTLISETAKKKGTWDLLIEKPFSVNESLIKHYLMSNLEIKQRELAETEPDSLEEAQRYVDLSKVTKPGLRFWDGFSMWLRQQDDFTAIQKNFASIIRDNLKKQHVLSEVEIRNGLRLLEKFNEQNVPEEYICSLSKLSPADIVDPAQLYTRMLAIPASGWKRVLDVGEQTHTFSFNEIAVIKTVIAKLKVKEQIDIQRLQIVDECLKKLKRYNLDY